jgi:hypothetical protein
MIFYVFKINILRAIDGQSFTGFFNQNKVKYGGGA